MLVLVTNDDGIDAEGLKALGRAFSKDHELWIVAPKDQQSGSSHKITLDRPLRIAKLGERKYAVNGAPTDAVYMAVNHLMPKRPDMIISGINLGPNLGDDVLYSGTVAAAMEGAIQGIPSLAISLAVFKDPQWDASAEAALVLAERIRSAGLPEGMFLNVNVPPDARPGGLSFRFTRQGKRDYRQNVILRKDPRGRDYYWLGGDAAGSKSVEGGDIEAVESGFVSVTPLTLDLTDYAALRALKAWEAELGKRETDGEK